MRERRGTVRAALLESLWRNKVHGGKVTTLKRAHRNLGKTEGRSSADTQITVTSCMKE